MRFSVAQVYTPSCTESARCMLIEPSKGRDIVHILIRGGLGGSLSFQMTVTSALDGSISNNAFLSVNPLIW